MLATLVAGCSVTHRQGRPFDELFPDASVLVTTADPTSVRERLDQAQLPDTSEHHQRLLGLLRSREQLQAAHLVLLTRAVARNELTNVYINGKRTITYGPRGRGEPARIIDQLLTEGADRVTDVDADAYGELLGITQSDATMKLYVDRFHAKVDDGSDAALERILGGLAGSPALAPFLGDHLAPRGGLAGGRGWTAFRCAAFDGDRLVVLRLLLAKGETIAGDRMVQAVSAFSFDDGRKNAFALLAPKVQPLQIEDACACLKTFAFDSGREAALATLGQQADVQVTEKHLLAFMNLCAFDSGKLHCVQALRDRVGGDVDGDAARDLLAAFRFDSDRQAALATMAPRWLDLPVESRRRLLTTFSFDSSRQQAMTLLMK